MKTQRVAFAALGAVVLIVSAQARAAQSDDAVLRQEVTALREMVLALQTRVTQLEALAGDASRAVPPEPKAAAADTAPIVRQTPAVAVAPPAATMDATAADATVAPPVGASPAYISPEAALRANWSKVARGMQQDEIVALIGAPSQKATLDGRTVWYYYYPGAGAGSVFFTDAGRVSSRQSPFGLGW